MLLTLALVDWPSRGGSEMRVTPETLEAWPEADVMACYARAEALRRPGVTEGKA
jgi:hypothetical protein